MPTTIEQNEELPESYYPVASYTHRPVYAGEDAEISADLVWQRIESYIAHRYSPRSVIWKVEGAGEWIPPLTPISTISFELWNGSEWESATVDSGAFGYCLTSDGPYRVTATVGDDGSPTPTPPEAVQEAWRRLHEYTRGIAEQFKGDAAFLGDENTEITRGWTARALQLSGAADLLRPYRRA